MKIAKLVVCAVTGFVTLAAIATLSAPKLGTPDFPLKVAALV
jgi:hypothetical protein